MLGECLRVDGCTTTHNDVVEIRRGYDAFLDGCHLRQCHQGYRPQGRTPAKALRVTPAVEELAPSIQFTPETLLIAGHAISWTTPQGICRETESWYTQGGSRETAPRG